MNYYSSHNNRNNAKLITLALAGLAVGVAVWYLLGTEKGRETKDHLLGSLNDFGGTMRDKVKEGVDKYSGKADDLADDLKSKANNAY